MRVLEPRVLLDAAALETALDVAAQAVHSDLAEIYLSPEAQARPPAERTPFATHRAAAFAGLEVERHDDDGDTETDTQAAVPSERAREIVFVDGALPQLGQLVADIDPDVEIHVLDLRENGVAQMAAVLEGRSGIETVHILSHGREGALVLGGATLDRQSIAGEHAGALATIRDALAPDADLLVYGCDFGAGEAGRQATTLLARATGADIAVSTDITGSADEDGDWDLELRVGDVEARAFALKNFDGTLMADTYIVAPTGQPTISHVDGGVIGTVDTVARWSGAVTYDDGGTTLTYDLVAQYIGAFGETSLSFETVGDDVRVSVTNIGAIGGDGLSEPGAVTVLWRIVEPGTNTLAPRRDVDLIFTDIDGVGGVPDTGDGVTIDTSNLSAYTLGAGSNLAVFPDSDDIGFFGTQAQDPADESGRLGARWNDSADWLTVFHTRNPNTVFDVDGDGDFAFTNGITVLAQEVDLDGDDSSGATNGGFDVVYPNRPAGQDAGVPVADADAVLRDLNDTVLQSLTVEITNASAGDMLVHDAATAAALGIDVNVTTAGSSVLLTATPANFDADGMPIASLEAFLRGVVYRNDNADAAFDRTYARTIDVRFSDFNGASDPATATVTFAPQTMAPTLAPVAFAALEDQAIVRDAASGLLANVVAPAGSPTIVGAALADGTPITVGSDQPMPSGATLRIETDGRLTYTPASHVSGVEVVRFTVESGGQQVESWVSLAIAPVADMPTLTVTPADPSPAGSDLIALEDEASDALDVTFTTVDPSEERVLLVVGLLEGAVVTDGTNAFRSDGPGFDIAEVTDWDLTQLRVLPPEDSDQEITITLQALSIEADGTAGERSEDITFRFDAVADEPNLLIENVSAPIDADADIGRAITVEVTDEDGSEDIASLTITDIPPEVTFFVDGVQRNANFPPVGLGSLVLTPAEVAGLTMAAPKDGQPHDYTFQVYAAARESSPNGDIAVFAATQGPVELDVSINALNDPVDARDDRVSAISGATVEIDILSNDLVPDGGELVLEINGMSIDPVTPVALPGGEGTVTLSGSGRLSFTAAPDFSGTVTFEYLLTDVDGDLDTAEVVVDVAPRWTVETATPNVTEGGFADFTIGLDGRLAPGDTVAVEPFVTLLTADGTDVGDLDVALTNAVAADPTGAFGWDGTSLTWSRPQAAYVASPGGDGYSDIASSGAPQAIVTDGIVEVALGFDFDFFGQTFDRAYVSANGYLTFGSPAGTSDNVAMDGSALGGRPAIAAFWDDLDVAVGNDIYVETIDGPVGARQVTIQFDVGHAGGTEDGAFQIVLFEADGRVEVRYDDVIFGNAAVDGGASATVGVQGLGFGTTYSLDAASLLAGDTVTFAPDTTVQPRLAVSLDLPDDAVFEVEEQFEIALVNPFSAAHDDTPVTFTIGVSDNTAPVANPDALATDKTVTVTADLLAGTNGATADSDADGHILSLAQIEGAAFTVGTPITLASGALVTVDASGLVTYDPNGAFDGLNTGDSATDTFTYMVSDGFGGTDTAQVDVTVNGLNLPPAIDLNGPGAGTAISHPYADTDPIVVVMPDATVADPDNATVASLTLTLGGFIQGTDERVTVLGELFEYGTARNVTVAIGATPVRLDYDGADTITMARDGGGGMPAAAFQTAIRTIGYDIAAARFEGGDRTITVTASDGAAISTPVMATISVTASNLSPVANDDGVPTPLPATEDTDLTITGASLLANDTDGDGDTLTIASVANGTGGTVTFDGTNVTFTPDADHTGTATFTYTVDDGNGGTDDATVTIDVAPVNDAPTVDLDTTMPGTGHTDAYVEDGPAVAVVPANAAITDVDGDPVQSAIIRLADGHVGDLLSIGALPGGITATTAPPEAATTGLTTDRPVLVTLTGPATPGDMATALRAVTFSTTSDTPDTSDRTFQVRVNDGALDSNIAITTITVAAANDAPLPADDGVPTPLAGVEDMPLDIPVADLLANDVDPDGDTLTIVSVQGAVNGAVSMTGGTITFTPDADHSGLATFTYTVEDAAGVQRDATVSIDFAAVNDRPIVDLDMSVAGRSHDTTFTEGTGAVAIAASDATITDIDSPTLAGLTVRIADARVGDILAAPGLPGGLGVNVTPTVPLAADGALTLQITGSAPLATYEAALRLVTFENASDAPSTDLRSATVTVNDGTDTSIVAVSNIDVVATPDDPVAVADGPLSVAEDDTLRVAIATLLANDYDPDGEVPTLMGVSNPVNGTVTVDGTDVAFTPTPDFSGTATFDYTIEDALGATATTTVTVNVTPVNDVPTLDLDANTTGLDHAFTYTENDPATALLDPSVAVTDVEGRIVGATIRLTNGRVGDVIEAGAMPPGLSFQAIPSGPLVADGAVVATIVGTGTPADYQTALTALTYRSTSENPSTAQRTVEVTVNDGDDVSAVARVAIDVISVNEDPIVTNDGPITIVEDTPATIAAATLLANDNDPDGDAIIINGVSNAVGGTAVLTGGSITFTPDADHTGAASFDYTVSDGLGGTATATATLDVVPVNDAPTLDASLAAPGTGLTLGYTENDAPLAIVAADVTIADVDDADIAWASVLLRNGRAGDMLEVGTLPPGINASIVPTGALVADGAISLTLTGPATRADYEAALQAVTFRSASENPAETPRAIEIVVNDGAAISNVANVSIDVTATNDAPVAGPDGPFTTPEDTALDIAAALLLANDTDADGDALVITGVSNPVGGTVTLTGGTITFSPDPDTNTVNGGPASFDYTLSDGSAPVTGTVAIQVTPVEDAPTLDLDGIAPGADYAVIWTEDNAAVPLVGAGHAITDVDSAQLASIDIRLTAGQTGDVIEVTGALPAGIAFNAIPAGPLVAPGPITVTLTGAADIADYEAALAALGFRSATQAPVGGERAIEIVASDGVTDSNLATARVTVVPVNDAPVAGDDGPIVVEEDTDLVIAPTDLLANDVDVDGDPLAIASVTNAVGGTVAIAGDGRIVFRPTADYNGPAGFDYLIDDGAGGTDTGQVDITVTAVDDAPTLDLAASTAGLGYSITYIENDGPTPVVGADIRIDDVDSPEIVSATVTLTNGQAGDVLEVAGLPPLITASTVPAGPLATAGPIVLTLTGPEITAVYEFALQAVSFRSVSEVPDETQRRIEIEVSDGTSSSALAVTTVDVIAVNDVPVAQGEMLSTLEDTPLTFDPTANDTDLDGDALTVSAVEGVPVAAGSTVTIGAGTVTVGADGRTLTFEPRANLNGQIAFTYEVSDGLDTGTALVAIDIIPVNDVPVAQDDGPITFDEDTSTLADPLANDTDADGDPFSIATLAGTGVAPGGTVSLAEGDVTLGLDGRTLTFTPIANFNGVVVVPYTIADGTGGTDEATITFDVTPVNDPLTLLGQPPDVTYDDGSAVSIDMSAYVDDPDGDPISYTVVGLPVGLAIDPDTGVISGDLDSDASSTSPYTITVTADDGMGSTIPVTFVLTAVNVAPVTVDNPTVPVRDGDIVAYATADAFVDGDGDALTYTVTGLPVWASLDAATGDVTGMVPFDASTLGPVAFTVTATDPSGAAASANFTFVPSNPPPVLERTIPTIVAGEEQPVDRDLSPFIRDGGMDGDALTWTVAGLPDGVTFDPATNRITGAPATGTLRPAGYRIDVVVEDGQGGRLDTHFLFLVGDTESLPDLDPFDAFALPDHEPEIVVEAAHEPIVLEAVDAAADLDGTADVSTDQPVSATVESVATLDRVEDVTGPAQDAALTPRGLVTDAPLAELTGGAGPALLETRPAAASAPAIDYVLDENGDLVVVFADAPVVRLDEEEPHVVEAPDVPALPDPVPAPVADAPAAPPAPALPVEPASSDPVDAAPKAPTLDVAAHVRPGQVFVDVRDRAREGLEDVVFALRNEGGENEGVAMRVVRTGFASFGVPLDLVDLGLTLAARHPDGSLTVEDVDVDAKTGSVRLAGSPEMPSEAPNDVPAERKRDISAEPAGVPPALP